MSAFHYHGAWKWLLGAAQDLTTGNLMDNKYVYGSEALTTGIENFNHIRERNW